MMRSIRLKTFKARMRKMNNKQWVPWMGSVFIAGVLGTFSLMIYTHATFATKGESTIQGVGIERQFRDIQQRLDRIEDKIDALKKR